MILSTLILLACFSPAPVLSQAGENALEQALASIDADEIRSDLYFFADRAMRGRPTPSSTQRVAALFLRSRLMRLGWRPAGDFDKTSGRRSWFQSFEVYQRALDLRKSSLVLRAGDERRRLRLGKDYFLVDQDQIRNLEFEGQVLYAGAGTLKDLAGLALEGRWALCLDAGRYDAARSERVQAAGAIGLLLMANPDQPGDRIGRQYPRIQRIKTVPRFFSKAPIEAQASLPLIYLKRSAAAAILSFGQELEAQGLPAVGSLLKLQLREKRAGCGLQRTDNVCALWPGSDPSLEQEVILISAHYDHLTPIGARVYQGADDNGSGSMGLLELAEALVLYGAPKRSVMLLWLTGEEHGLWGSKAFAANPTLLPGQRAICNVNIDMIGRNAGDSLLITPSPKHARYNGVSALLHELGPLEGFPKLGSADDYWERSDHHTFSTVMGLPVAFLFAGVHGDYHKPSDTPEKVNCEKVRRAMRLVLRLVDRLQVDALKL